MLLAIAGAVLQYRLGGGRSLAGAAEAIDGDSLRLLGEARLRFNQGQDRERGDSGAERIVGARWRSVDVEALGAFAAAPRAVGPLISQ